MTTKQMTLWQAIEVLAQQVPFTKAKVETVLSTPLHEKRRSTHTTFLEGDGVGFVDGAQVTKVDLRLGNAANDAGFMVLELDGACITLEQVRNHYSNLEITGTPRGHSLDEATSHSAFLSWGKLSFGFAERNRDCLAWIAFDPKKAN